MRTARSRVVQKALSRPRSSLLLLCASSLFLPSTSHRFSTTGFFSKFFSPAKSTKTEPQKQKAPEEEDEESFDEVDKWLSENGLADASLKFLELAVDEQEKGTQRSSALLQAASGFFQMEMPPFEYYGILIQALQRDDCRQDKIVKQYLFLLLRHTVPDFVMIVFSEADVLEKSLDEQAPFHHLVEIALGFPDDVDAAIQRVKANAPSIIVAGASITKLFDLAPSMAARAELLRKVVELCQSFDPHKTGKILLKEFETVLTNVVGQHEAQSVLKGIEADNNGHILYAQAVQIIAKCNTLAAVTSP